VIATIEPPCGVPAHRMGRWEDEVLGIWWCPDCHEEIWVREGTDAGEEPAEDVRPLRPEGAAVPVRSTVQDRGDGAGASRDRAWRDSAAGARLWHLIVEAFR
jgi:hypothetical protein